MVNTINGLCTQIRRLVQFIAYGFHSLVSNINRGKLSEESEYYLTYRSTLVPLVHIYFQSPTAEIRVHT